MCSKYVLCALKLIGFVYLPTLNENVTSRPLLLDAYPFSTDNNTSLGEVVDSDHCLKLYKRLCAIHIVYVEMYTRK